MNSSRISTLLLLLGLLTASMATTCYECTGLGDEACNDAYSGNVDHKVDCSLNNDMEDDGCSKSKSSVTLLGVKVTTVQRSCGKLYDNSQCAQKDRSRFSNAAGSVQGWECSCDGDRCNTAYGLHVKSIIPVLVLVITALTIIRFF